MSGIDTTALISDRGGAMDWPGYFIAGKSRNIQTVEGETKTVLQLTPFDPEKDFVRETKR